jgi:hypothetical protein
VKVRIVQSGWEGFNGQLGEVQFQDGVSVDEMTPLQVARLGAIVSVENVETSEQVGPAVDVLKSWDSDCDKAVADQKNADEVKDCDTTRGSDEHVYTEDELAKLADAHGIKGIREVADQFGLKSTSIRKLIDGIMAAQKKGARASVAVTPESVAEKLESMPKDRLAKDAPKE